MDTLVSVLRHAASNWPDREALRFDGSGESLTFADFDGRTDAIAAGLVAAGVQPGDRIAICSANRPLFPLAWFAAMKAGAVMVPINISYRADDARHILALTEPKAIMCERERVGLFDAMRQDLPTLRICVAECGDVPTGWMTLASVVALGTCQPPMPLVKADDVTNIQFTSGTSGLPKGCMLPHAYWIALATAVDTEVMSLQAGDTMLTAQAFSYLDPQWALAMTLMKGARLVALERFRPSELWEKIGHYEARFFYCLAAMPLMLLSRSPAPAEKNHKLAAVMCSAIPADRHRELEQRFAVAWVEAYGSTETGSDLGVSWSDHPHMIGTGTIGKPLPGREAIIVDENFQEVGQGEAGELLVRSEAMMKGYWRDPEATEKAFYQGWYRTGDLARVDEENFFYLVGRRKEMIRRAGENIAANEIEAALHQHPAVLLAACIAVPDAVRNEEIKAFVVRQDIVEASELAAFLSERLARFKVPRYWTFVDELPMTPSERVAKPQLSQDVGEGVYDLQHNAPLAPRS